MRAIIALTLAVSLTAHAQTSDLRASPVKRVVFSLLGGAAGGLVLTGIVAAALCKSSCTSGYVLALGSGLAWTTGVAIGTWAAEKIGPDEVDVLPVLAGSALGALFATAVTLLPQNDRDRVIVGIPAFVVLPLAFATLGLEYARPRYLPVQPALTPVPGGAVMTIGGSL